jgi:hypothetical protein
MATGRIEVPIHPTHTSSNRRSAQRAVAVATELHARAPCTSSCAGSYCAPPNVQAASARHSACSALRHRMAAALGVRTLWRA